MNLKVYFTWGDLVLQCVWGGYMNLKVYFTWGDLVLQCVWGGYTCKGVLYMG